LETFHGEAGYSARAEGAPESLPLLHAFVFSVEAFGSSAFKWVKLGR